jgi:hypothetical protein
LFTDGWKAKSKTSSVFLTLQGLAGAGVGDVGLSVQKRLGEVGKRPVLVHRLLRERGNERRHVGQVQLLREVREPLHRQVHEQTSS